VQRSLSLVFDGTSLHSFGEFRFQISKVVVWFIVCFQTNGEFFCAQFYISEFIQNIVLKLEINCALSFVFRFTNRAHLKHAKFLELYSQILTTIFLIARFIIALPRSKLSVENEMRVAFP
jgi:hypothetical protein